MSMMETHSKRRVELQLNLTTPSHLTILIMAFRFRNQPWKSLYILYFGLTTLVLRLPVWVLLSLYKSTRTWSVRRTIYFKVIREYIGRFFVTGFPSPPVSHCGYTCSQIEACPQLVVGEIKEIARVNGVQSETTTGFWYTQNNFEGPVDRMARDDETIVYHIHGLLVLTIGGAFSDMTSSLQEEHLCPADSMTPVLCEGLLRNCSSLSRMFCVEYRISSTSPFPARNPFPAALLDALAGYRHLVVVVGFKPQNIIISGDSAGGQIALSLARYLSKYALTALAPPGGLLLISPSADWGRTHDNGSPTESITRNADTDFGAPFYQGYPTRAIIGRMQSSEAAANPWISAASLKLPEPKGLFSGLPRTCIISGEAEIQLDSIHTLRDRLIHDTGNSNVTYIESFGSTHCFVCFKAFEPERTAALTSVGEWIDGMKD
ncbi:alpha/beta-hydrolase [Desarmillaria tabescens]|uniref:Alpha/beta-hydrolase n=1 Tax=Armillaria tabescens TaxID=1929756 RepID=A0AA39N6M7_ARMTA|nr:alpha/beta-hydrolase [Desarmillaria tabescens]KAK0459245.1 alpha/beta-hydrolase [Desarmillaria tabescens]